MDIGNLSKLKILKLEQLHGRLLFKVSFFPYFFCFFLYYLKYLGRYIIKIIFFKVREEYIKLLVEINITINLKVKLLKILIEKINLKRKLLKFAYDLRVNGLY